MPINHLVGTRRENEVKPRVGKNIVYKDALAFLNGGSGDADNRASNADPPFRPTGTLRWSISGYARGYVPDRPGISGLVKDNSHWPPTITTQKLKIERDR